MKIIGKTEYSDVFICTVSETELKKFFNMYYANTEMKNVKSGDSIDLGKGHDFHQDISSAFRKTQEFINSHKPIFKALANGLSIDALVRTSQEEPTE